MSRCEDYSKTFDEVSLARSIFAAVNQLQSMNNPVERKLNSVAKVADTPIKFTTNESAFRFALNNDAMATEKLAEGIRAFAADSVKLDALVVAAK